ncbi:MAG TPA: NAD(P)H-binding protein [Trebonia sp.]|nr:NAD(P)H-binding protein [Trebonia sp.]
MATFLILGGTGKVGRRLSHSLAAAGHEPRPASRHSAVRFDWADDSSWPAALDGADGVFIVGPGSAADWSPRLVSLLAAAKSAGARHAVLLSARGVEFLPGGAVDRAEQALRDGPLPWTILRPTHFSQNFTEAMFAPRDGLILAPAGTGAEPFIDVGDIAEVAAAVLGQASYHHETLDMSGPEAVSFPDAAAILSAVSGTPVRFADESDADHVARLRAAGTPEGYIRWRMAMLGGIRRGADAYLSDGVQRVLGRPPAGLREWAQREVPASAWARAARSAEPEGRHTS